MIEALRHLADNTIEKASKLGASQVQAVVYVVDDAGTRFAHNFIHQNVTSRDLGVHVTVVVEKNKVGSALVRSLEPAEVEKGVGTAVKAAKVSKPNPDFKTLPSPKKIAPLAGLYVESTAKLEPERKAESIGVIVNTAKDYDKRIKSVFGYFANSGIGIVVANSLGINEGMEFSMATVETITMAEENGSEGRGFSSGLSRDVSELDFKALARESATGSVNSLKPKKLDVGEYEAILKPNASSTLIGSFGRIGFSAESYQENRSFLMGRLGDQVFDEKLSILDNGRDKSTPSASAFDGEGVPKKALMLINHGVAENLCYDSYTAGKEGKESTGHAPLGIGRMGGPGPTNMIVEPGDCSLDELIEDTKRGLLITRFHYTGIVRPDLAIITGTTSDGTWFIENGEIKHPVLNLRFTESMLKTFGEISGVGNESTVKKTGGWGGVGVAINLPAIKLKSFRITGQTEF